MGDGVLDHSLRAEQLAALVQLTHIDNRSDGLDYGPLFNWGTRFDVVSAEYTAGDWTIAAESGWGPTLLVVYGTRYSTDLRASYALVSRRFTHGRATIRVEDFRAGTKERALTLAYLWSMRGRFRPGVEITTTRDDQRVILDFRYSFSGN